MRKVVGILALVVGLSLIVSVPVFADNVARFIADLDGGEEVPAVVTDTTSEFRIRFNEDFTEATFRLRVHDGLAVTQAHLHCAPAGVNGPIVVFLSGMVPGGFDVDGELAEFTLTNANVAAVGANCVPTTGRAITNLAQLAEAAKAGLIYANVHTVAHPGGEVRGIVEVD